MNFLNIGTSEILLLAILVFLIFGPRQLSHILRSIGRALYEVQKTLQGISKDLLEEDTPEKIK